MRNAAVELGCGVPARGSTPLTGRTAHLWEWVRFAAGAPMGTRAG